MPDNIECPDRITRHSEVSLASFVEIADDLLVTGHRLSRRYATQTADWLS
jgi:hypothetical protein